MPQQCLLGNLPGFVYSHDEFPQAGDVFWSPADWAWTGGLMDALLPTLYFGCAVVGYRGRFDPERALELIEKYRVRNTFLFPTALKMMMKAVPQPRERYDVNMRSMMSAGEAVGTTVFEWSQQALGVTTNEMFGQTERNYIVGNSHTLWPAKPGSIGRQVQGGRLSDRSVRDRELPRSAPCGGQCRDRAQSRRDAREYHQGVYRPGARTRSIARARGCDPAPRARPSGALRISERDRIHRRLADDDDRQGSARRAAAAR